ncbi:hypothetical protein E2C01_051593 [Portunus trituberculatus]|uniref:Uncharacterized protein n=1 Tax=Portunus trituberculatus TaxID=210409 RepID=A0A5B7GKR1_PORTR|nr:hypothetical protein [Portunus trituberculatus]
MATPSQASESSSEAGTRNVPRSDSSPGGDPKCLHTSRDFFFNNFCNIRVGCCIYVHNDLTSSRTHALISSEFFTIWLRLNSQSLKLRFLMPLRLDLALRQA